MNRQSILVLAVLAALMFAMHFTGGWYALGAHRFWSLKATAYGVGGGVVAVFVLLRAVGPRYPAAAAGFVAAALAAVASYLGNRQFVATSADDKIAGLFWYLGFAAVIGGLFVGFGVLAIALIARRRRAAA